jgi:hypothetical protein
MIQPVSVKAIAFGLGTFFLIISSMAYEISGVKLDFIQVKFFPNDLAYLEHKLPMQTEATVYTLN